MGKKMNKLGRIPDSEKFKMKSAVKNIQYLKTSQIAQNMLEAGQTAEGMMMKKPTAEDKARELDPKVDLEGIEMNLYKGSKMDQVELGREGLEAMIKADEEKIKYAEDEARRAKARAERNRYNNRRIKDSEGNDE